MVLLLRWCSCQGWHEAGREGVAGRLGPIADPDRAETGREIVLDRALGKPQFVGDLPIAVPRHQQPEQHHLPPAEPGGPPPLRPGASQRHPASIKVGGAPDILHRSHGAHHSPRRDGPMGNPAQTAGGGERNVRRNVHGAPLRGSQIGPGLQPGLG